MRSHSVPNFPDPKKGANGHGIIGGGADFHSSQVETARKAFRPHLPGA